MRSKVVAGAALAVGIPARQRAREGLQTEMLSQVDLLTSHYKRFLGVFRPPEPSRR